MNKTMLCIELLQLLSAKDIMNKNELADALEINPRNVKEYIKTLQDCGYDIESVRGIYSGNNLLSFQTWILQACPFCKWYCRWCLS